MRAWRSLTAWEALVLLAGGLYAAALMTLCHLKYRGLGYTDFDLAIHAQSTWNLLHGNLDTSILGIPFLGNHMVLILFLVAPLYALVPSPLLLLHLQTLVLAVGAWAVYRLATRELSPRWGAGFALAYLLYPPLIFMNLYEFHPVALATTFLLFALDGYRSQRFPRFAVALGLALLCQENLGLVAAAWGVWAWMDHRRGRWAWAPLLTGAASFAVAVIWVMPRLNPHVQFYSMYSHLGRTFPELVGNLVRHPSLALETALAPTRFVFFNLLLAPLAYASLLAPTSLIPSVPVALQHLLSSRATESSMIYHYQAEFIPFVFGAAIHGIRNVLSHSRPPRVRRAIAVAVAAMTALSFTLSVALPGLLLDPDWPITPADDAAVKRRVLAAIPPDAPVAATFEFLAPLANRRELTSLHHLTTGTYTLSAVPYPMPAPIDYLLVNTHDPMTFHCAAFYRADGHQRLQRLVSTGSWETVEQVNGFVAWRRVAPEGPGITPLAGPVDSIPPDVNHAVQMAAQEGASHLAGFIVSPMGETDAALTLFWDVRGSDTVDFDLKIRLRNGNALIHEAVLAPGHRIWPPHSWVAGSPIADRHVLRLASPLPTTPGAWSLEAEKIPVVPEP